MQELETDRCDNDYQYNSDLLHCLETTENNWWVVLEFCPQEGACEIPVPMWNDQDDALHRFALEIKR